VSFNRDIRPILSDNCYACHGPDENTREADLRLDIEANAFVPHGKYEAAIIKGDPKHSPLYQRIITEDADDIMPPLDSHKELSAEEKRLIEQWIKEGAEWEGHWAFEKPEKPDVPEQLWGVNSVDAFTYRAMQEKGLEPNPEADRATLARRLSLDLTGLPPNPQTVDRFVNDTSENAYESLVDALLGLPSYGEHQARYWLDAARYADTHGLHLDNYREIWPYRDWVAKAFNETSLSTNSLSSKSLAICCRMQRSSKPWRPALVDAILPLAKEEPSMRSIRPSTQKTGWKPLPPFSSVSRWGAPLAMITNSIRFR